MRWASCTFLWVRTDLPLADQMVQAAHAAQEAGARWGVPHHCHLVLLGAPDKRALCKALDLCEQRGIGAVSFEEPNPVSGESDRMGLTAVCTAPVPPDAQRLFRRFPLWKPDGRT